MKSQLLDFFKSIISFLLAISILSTGCSSTTLIKTDPPDAKLYMNDELMGRTPYSYTDKKIAGSQTQIRIEKEGYDTFYTTLKRNERADVGAIVVGVFLILIPFLWMLQYKPERMYELKKEEEGKEE